VLCVVILIGEKGGWIPFNRIVRIRERKKCTAATCRHGLPGRLLDDRCTVLLPHGIVREQEELVVISIDGSSPIQLRSALHLIGRSRLPKA